MKILGIFAHPDDEAIIVGGTIAKAVSLGHDVYLVCATKGEASSSYDREYCTEAQLPAVRAKEFMKACEILGATEGKLLNFIDGTLSKQKESAGVAALMTEIKRIQPDLILTFEPEGISFHADHKTVHRWVMKALSDPWFDNRGTEVYWATVNQGAGRAREGKLMGHPAKDITSRVIIEPWKAIKQEAVLAHRTQLPLFLRTGLITDNQLGRNFKHEYFIRVDHNGQPEVEPGSDLFDTYWVSDAE